MAPLTMAPLTMALLSVGLLWTGLATTALVRVGETAGLTKCHADCYRIASTLACWGRALRWRDWPPRRSVRAQWEAVRCGHECRPGHEWSPSSCASPHTQVGCVRDRRDRAL
eukprot:scaffold68271_cov83-Phaeocystis_antarctica.AAC.2